MQAAAIRRRKQALVKQRGKHARRLMLKGKKQLGK